MKFANTNYPRLREKILANTNLSFHKHFQEKESFINVSAHTGTYLTSISKMVSLMGIMSEFIGEDEACLKLNGFDLSIQNENAYPEFVSIPLDYFKDQKDLRLNSYVSYNYKAAQQPKPKTESIVVFNISCKNSEKLPMLSRFCEKDYVYSYSNFTDNDRLKVEVVPYFNELQLKKVNFIEPIAKSSKHMFKQTVQLTKKNKVVFKASITQYKDGLYYKIITADSKEISRDFLELFKETLKKLVSDINEIYDHNTSNTQYKMELRERLASDKAKSYAEFFVNLFYELLHAKAA